MLRMHKRVGASVGVVVGAIVWAASMAFACTVAPQVSYSLFPESAAPGQTVTVEGKAVSSREPVQIRWNSTKGKVLATTVATNGAFSVPVTIPEVPNGVYSLMLVTADAGVGRTALEVTGAPGVAAPAATSAQLWPEAVTVKANPAPGPGPGQMGVALLAVGLVGLFAGSVVAVTHRRRAVLPASN